jgi:hypothetical protein
MRPYLAARDQAAVGPMTGARLAVDRGVVIVTAAGSFTPAGERLTGLVDSVGKLEKLIEWAHNRGLLRPQPVVGAGEKPRPNRPGCGGSARSAHH